MVRSQTTLLSVSAHLRRSITQICSSPAEVSRLSTLVHYNRVSSMAPSVLIPESLSFRQASFHKFPATEDLVPDTLNGWPMHLDNTLSWDGSTFCSEDEYTYTLTEHDKDEIRRALTFFKGQLPRVFSDSCLP
jgi:hypothetical protein